MRLLLWLLRHLLMVLCLSDLWRLWRAMLLLLLLLLLRRARMLGILSCGSRGLLLLLLAEQSGILMRARRGNHAVAHVRRGHAAVVASGARSRVHRRLRPLHHRPSDMLLCHPVGVLLRQIRVLLPELGLQRRDVNGNRVLGMGSTGATGRSGRPIRHV